jgi:fatty-acyl-CoA synthase
MASASFNELLDIAWPIIAWLALIYFGLRFLFRRWEVRIFAERNYQLKLPMSPLAFLDRRILIEGLVKDPVIQKALRKQSAETGEPFDRLEKRARSQAREIVPAFKAVAYFRIIYWIARFLILVQYRVKIVGRPVQGFESIGPDATVVLVMNHRSNMDVLLANYLTSRHSTLSHAAGEWARTWPLHHIVRLAGNYVIDRDANDPLYRVLLRRYLEMAVTHGINVAVFPEGELTRDGKLQAPQFGLLNYFATAQWPGQDRDIVFIPTSFNYDRIPEQDQLVLGSEESFRERGHWYMLWSAIRFTCKYLLMPLLPRDKRYGYACASFGEPVSLKAWESANHISLRKLSAERRREYIEMLGLQLMDRVEEGIPVMPSHMLATAMLRCNAQAADRASLLGSYQEVAGALEITNAPMFSYERDKGQAFDLALQTLVNAGALKVLDSGNVEPVEGKRALLQYYANSIAGYLRADLESESEHNGAHWEPAAVDNYMAVYAQSYDRITRSAAGEKGFFTSFYQHFLSSSPLVAAKFTDTDLERQRDHLRQSLMHMIDFSLGNRPSERLLQIAGHHGRNELDIAADLYDLWLSALIGSVAEHDEEFDLGVELSWRKLMAPGIAFMRGHYNDEKLPAKKFADVPKIPVDRQGIARWLDHWGTRSPKKIALSDAENRLSYRQCARNSRRLAAALQADCSISSGDRVAYLAGNRIEFIILLFACARLGAVLVPINARLAAEEQLGFLHTSTPRALVGDSQSIAKLGGLGCPVPVVIDLDGVSANTLHYADLVKHKRPGVPNTGTLDDPLLIVFTSGTSGQPKGAVLTQKAMHWNALNSRLMHDMCRSDHVLTTLPFFHVGGINIQTLPAISCGARVTLMDRFDASEFIGIVERERPTLTVVVPAQMRLIMELPGWNAADISSLRLVATGSTLVPRDLISSWGDRGIPLIQVYGCTESSPIAVHQTGEGIKRGAGTVGHGALYTDVQIQDETGAELGVGKEGEIVLRGPNVMSHYWNDEAATRAAFRNDWLLTGDLGFRDKSGRLHVTGRKKQLIISGGENIHPAEIERVLESHPGVVEAAVVGISDPKWDEVPVAVVAADVSKEEIQHHLNRQLGRYKHPRHILFIGRLPRTALDKVAYSQVSEFVGRELHLQELSNPLKE